MSGCIALTEINLNNNKQLTAAGMEPFCASPPPNLAILQMNRCDLAGGLLVVSNQWYTHTFACSLARIDRAASGTQRALSHGESI